MSALAVIGGTGIDVLEGLDVLQSHQVDTPFGDTSRAIQEGRFGDIPLYFLQRHGSPGAIPPHRINYRANVWALKSLGVEGIVAINAVGGITNTMHPGCVLIPHQVIDYTWGREHTYDDGQSGHMMHIDFTEPYERKLRLELVAAAESAGIVYVPDGVHGVTQGPRLETAAEIQRLKNDGCDVVGMTGMPEAALARELDLPYASICMVVNAAAGLGDTPLTMALMRKVLVQEAAAVRQLLHALLSTRPSV